MSGTTKNQDLIHSGQNSHSEPQVSHEQNQVQTKSIYHDDYDKIQSAVLETKRGRWFLGEFAQRNKIVESQMVLTALKELEAKLPNTSDSQPQVQAAPLQAAPQQQADFTDETQSTQFAHLFGLFKQKTIDSLQWAGIKSSIPFSKIQTIINFANQQSTSSLQKQQKNLLDAVTQLQQQPVDKILIKKIEHIASELHKTTDLQNNLNQQLSDGIKFMAEAEKIADNLPIDLEQFSQSLGENELKAAKSELKTTKNELKNAENELESLKNTLKTIKIELENAQNTVKKAEITPETTPPNPQEIAKLGPAGRIKKMFKIEHTLQQQQGDEFVEPGQAFDQAFENEQLVVKKKKNKIKAMAEARQISTPENIEQDIQPNPASVTNNQISAQSKKLNHISEEMKQAKTNVDAPEIIVEKKFNALNALALLSKTERTMLFTLQN